MGVATRLFESIEGIEWFPIISLIIFIVFFTLIAIHALTMKKSKEEECGRLPLENDEKLESTEV